MNISHSWWAVFFSFRLDLRATVPSRETAFTRSFVVIITIIMSAPQRSSPPVQGQFAWFAKIGGTPEVVATLNDQPYVFFVLLAALIILILEGVFIWYIHYATMKPEQKKKKEKKGDKGEKKPGGKPPAQR
ncbi:hypothetical protein F5X98DRAFT_373463 [Xylaria grammica]|nr:hypothetical protein F5X98DRAFT_373463 [Xylaria grammica]